MFSTTVTNLVVAEKLLEEVYNYEEMADASFVAIKTLPYFLD